MALPALATADDLATWLGLPAFTAQDKRRAEAVLRAASARVRRTANATWVDADGAPHDVPEDAVTVTLEIAASVYRNPEGYKRVQLGTFSADVDGGLLRVTDDQAAVLAGITAGDPTVPARPRLWTLSTTRDAPHEHQFLTDQYAGDPILDA